jgi:hypothetical protein
MSFNARRYPGVIDSAMRSLKRALRANPRDGTLLWLSPHRP